MAGSVSSSSRKEVITDVVTTTLQKTTSRLVPDHSMVPDHSNAFPTPLSQIPVGAPFLDPIVPGKHKPIQKLPRPDPRIQIFWG
jgi:hypothetical protein